MCIYFILRAVNDLVVIKGTCARAVNDTVMINSICVSSMIIIFTVKFFRVLMRMCVSQYVYECMSVCAVSN